MTPIELVIYKVRTMIDAEAARYIEQKYNENSFWEHWENCVKSPEAISNLFSWSITPQGYDYWRTIHNKYSRLPTVIYTPKGNIL